MPTLLVVGATSDIARETARIFLKNGWDLRLAAKNPEKLEALATALGESGAGKITLHHHDVLEEDKLTNLWEETDPKPDALLVSVGFLGDRTLANDPDFVLKVTRINYLNLLPVITLAGAHYEKVGKGSVIGIASVAGDRARASNYPYGAAKAGFSAFLAGLRNRLFHKGVHVMTVKPGYVRTAMTEGLKIPGILTTTPEKAAKDIYRGFVKKRSVVYTAWYWRWIMLFVRILPEFVFKRTKF
ncbi:MAG: SDR family NAD(P)-dependent oxidoreductase [Deltaproteobacteria bacterium]|nr:SDR family NAD(P)-dependent oxidoreductase [Deltaproteobacteria bacterium]